MTRPKGDSDPWLTDMVSRDRVIAKTVVYGMREIISLLREIRDQQGAHMRAIRQLREDLMDARPQAAIATVRGPRYDFERCEKEGCSLPLGHMEAHRGSVRKAG